MSMPELVSISDGDSSCTICPALGGSIISWSVGEQQMFRRADADAIISGDPLSTASFPLVPFSNRVSYARFMWEGRQIELTPNFAPEPHAVHGVGWKDAWAIAERNDSHVVLSLHHKGDARWPWSFAATQSVRVKEGTLELKLCATNLASEAVPLAFGHHPYFDQEGADLSFTAARVLMSGGDALPTEAATPAGRFDFGGGGAVAGRDIDHCYGGWDGIARIGWEGRPLALEIDADMAAAVVYIPRGGSAFCFEPVPHINNALNRPGDLPAMPTIAPGESFAATIRFMAVRA
jgi:aldose 1-epimerase